MIVLEVTCQSRRHGESARGDGCVCPVDFGIPYRPPSPSRALPRFGRTRSGRLFRRTAPDVDDMAVIRAIDGDRKLRLTAVELDHAIDALDRPGVSSRLIAERLGVSRRTVHRRRAARRAAP